MEEKTYTLSQAQTHFAVDFHTKTWELLEKPTRTGEENERMIDYAHASLAHWRAAGTAARHQRGEWLLSRVYAVLGDAPHALRHARRCMEILESNQAEMADFDFAFAYEALARAYAVAEKQTEAKNFLELAKKAGEVIAEADDRQVFFDELNGGQWHGVHVS